jgi:hypothetical protein
VNKRKWQLSVSGAGWVDSPFDKKLGETYAKRIGKLPNGINPDAPFAVLDFA